MMQYIQHFFLSGKHLGSAALGGETLFEVPYHDANHTQPRLKLGGITFGYTGFGEMSFTEQANRDKLLRGDEVFNA